MTGQISEVHFPYALIEIEHDSSEGVQLYAVVQSESEDLTTGQTVEGVSMEPDDIAEVEVDGQPDFHFRTIRSFRDEYKAGMCFQRMKQRFLSER